MRGDIPDHQNYDGARTDSENLEKATIFGYDALKIAKYINLAAGVSLTVVCGMNILDIFKVFDIANFGLVILNIYECIFGLMIMASSFNMPCVKKNFLFLLTGIGRGAFNTYVGSLLFV